MNRQTLFFALSSTLLPALAQAQPGANNGPIAQNPPNQNMGGNRGGGGRGNRGPGGRGGFGGNLTDIQRQQLDAQTRQLQEIQNRQSLTLAGVTDPKVQDAIIAYGSARDAARQKLRDKWDALTQAVRDTTSTDTQIATLLNDFRGAVEDERTRDAAASAALETKLGLSKNPRLEAQLTLSGLLGDEASFIESTNQTGGRGAGGFGGGPGGFGGGPGGGPGGFGGGPGGGPGGFGPPDN